MRFSRIHAGALIFLVALILTSCKSLSEAFNPPKPTQPSLTDMIDSGNQAGIRELFANQEQLNSPDASGDYPLHKAVVKNSGPIVALLLALGAESDPKNAAGATPLQLAMQGGAKSCVKPLLDNGANIFAQDNSGRSPVDVALEKGPDSIAVLFNDRNINTKDLHGQTALHYASDKLLVKDVPALLGVGANPTLQDANKRTPLDLAFLHPDRVEAAYVSEALVQAGGTSSSTSLAWFVQAARSHAYSTMHFDDGGSTLHQAIEHRQIGFAAFLLEGRVDANAKNSAGSSALHEATRDGWLDGMKLLLENKADPNVRDNFDNTPLLIALPPLVQVDGVRVLLSHGADPALKDKTGATALLVAVQLGYPKEAVMALLEAKAPVNLANNSGITPLHVAIKSERYEHAKLLIAAGADIFALSKAGESPLILALKKDLTALESLLDARTVTDQDTKGNAALANIVVEKASPEAIRLLVSRGALVNAKNNAGDTALHYAVRYDYQVQGEALLAAGADIFVSNALGESPISLALRNKTGIIGWLFTPSTIVARDEHGNTILHHAARLNLYQTFDFLVRQGAKLEATNEAGETPLLAAVKADAAESARALIVMGASVLSRDALGSTCLHLAVLWEAQRTLPILVAGKADLEACDFNEETALHVAIRKRNQQAFTFLLKHAANPNTQNARGQTPLMLSVRSLSYDFERELLAAHANVTARDANGRTALHDAAEMGDDISTAILISGGASILAEDAEGNTPLLIALKKPLAFAKTVFATGTLDSAGPDGRTAFRIIVDSGPSLELLSLALASNPQLDAQDKLAQTALIAAVRKKNYPVAERLIGAGASLFAKDSEGESAASLILKLPVENAAGLIKASRRDSADRLGNSWLHYAAMAGSVENTAWIMAAGFEKNGKNLLGETPLVIAQKRNRNEIVALFK